MFKLALALGKTVAQLADELGSDELTEWMAYDRIDPFGQWRDNYHAGLIAALLKNRYRQPEDPTVTPADYIYGSEDRLKAKRTADAIAKLEALSVKNNGPN